MQFEKDWLTYKESWVTIGCCKTKLFELLKVGILKTQIVGSTHLVERASIEKYLANKPRRREYLEVLIERKQK